GRQPQPRPSRWPERRRRPRPPSGAGLPARRDDRLARALVHVDLPRVVIALPAGVWRLHVLRHRLAPPITVVRSRHVSGARVMERDATAADRARDGPRLVGRAVEEVALHTVDDAVLEHILDMAAVDEVHAAVGPVDVLQRDPAGDPLVLQVAAPV